MYSVKFLEFKSVGIFALSLLHTYWNTVILDYRFFNSVPVHLLEEKMLPIIFRKQQSSKPSKKYYFIIFIIFDSSPYCVLKFVLQKTFLPLWCLIIINVNVNLYIFCLQKAETHSLPAPIRLTFY